MSQAEIVRGSRQSRGLNQAELADLMSCNGKAWQQATVSRVEAGRRDLTLGEALTLARVLGIDVFDLADEAS